MFEPIGTVRCEINEKVDTAWGKVISDIIINKSISGGLLGLEMFSHILVIYHLNEANFVKEEHLVRRPRGRDDMPLVGLFAQRVKDRPNPIGVTAVKLLSVTDNIIKVQGLDAIDGTPVLDIKPYFPAFDKVNNANVPNWVNVLMEDYF
jgi:tRNA-Thr(GGU) m(6)t(6)A37 methyltransferase TsaA